MKWIKKNSSSIFLAVIFILGLSLMLYPTISDYWNSFHQSRAIATYSEAVQNIDNDEYEALWAKAQKYNESLLNKKDRWILSEEEYAHYESIMDVSGSGIIGYIEIPNIRVSLPIYHGVGESVLQIAVGHIEGSSFPIGGASTHAVLSGHRGLPSARLFTDLDQLLEGDIFMLHILDETLTYEVDQVLIVEPHEVSDLEIVEGADLCTLVTCTPYGINSHRLLVRGHRIENIPEEIQVTADAIEIDPLLVAPVIAIPLLMIMFMVMMIGTRKNKKGKKLRKTIRKDGLKS